MNERAEKREREEIGRNILHHRMHNAIGGGQMSNQYVYNQQPNCYQTPVKYDTRKLAMDEFVLSVFIYSFFSVCSVKYFMRNANGFESERTDLTQLVNALVSSFSFLRSFPFALSFLSIFDDMSEKHVRVESLSVVFLRSLVFQHYRRCRRHLFVL